MINTLEFLGSKGQNFLPHIGARPSLNISHTYSLNYLNNTSPPLAKGMFKKDYFFGTVLNSKNLFTITDFLALN